MIPLRPELFSFADPKSVCRLSCTCKTLRSDVREDRVRVMVDGAGVVTQPPSVG